MYITHIAQNINIASRDTLAMEGSIDKELRLLFLEESAEKSHHKLFGGYFSPSTIYGLPTGSGEKVGFRFLSISNQSY